MKRFLAKISDIKNAMRVLEIMDECGCAIEKVTRDGLDEYDYWKIIPKWYVSEKDAKDLQEICLHKQHYCKRSRLWKRIFPNIREGYRYLYEYRTYK
jgi:hypothetical protein